MKSIDLDRFGIVLSLIDNRGTTLYYDYSGNQFFIQQTRSGEGVIHSLGELKAKDIFKKTLAFVKEMVFYEEESFSFFARSVGDIKDKPICIHSPEEALSKPKKNHIINCKTEKNLDGFRKVVSFFKNPYIQDIVYHDPTQSYWLHESNDESSGHSYYWLGDNKAASDYLRAELHKKFCLLLDEYDSL